MRTLILATASAIALGLAGAAPSYAAQGTATTPGSTVTQPATPPGATAQPATPTGAAQSSMPSAGASAAAPQPATPALGSNSQYNQPYTASTSTSGMNAARVTPVEVSQVQEKLRSAGLYHGRIDGRIGPETQQALRQYQHRNGLPVTARLDQDTLNRLLGTDVGQGSSTPGAATPSSGAGTAGSGAGGWSTSHPANTTK